MQDSNLILRDGSANLTATEVGTFVGSLSSNAFLDIGKGGVLNFVDLRIVVPSQSGTSPTLDARIEYSDDGSTVADYVDLTGGATITSASTFPVVLDKRLRTRHRYVRYNFIVTGTTPNFGAVKAIFESGLGFREANIPNT